MTDPDIRRMLDAARAADRPADVDREALLRKILAAPAPASPPREGAWVAAAGAVAAGAVAALLAWPTPAPTRAVTTAVAAPAAVTVPVAVTAPSAEAVRAPALAETTPVPATTVAPTAARRVATTPAPETEGDEWQIIRDADRALREHAPDRALAVLARHAVEHRRGVAAPEVLAYRVRAYCMAGRAAEARAVAAELRARAPTSPAAYALRATCAAEP